MAEIINPAYDLVLVYANSRLLVAYPLFYMRELTDKFQRCRILQWQTVMNLVLFYRHHLEK